MKLSNFNVNSIVLNDDLKVKVDTSGAPNLEELSIEGANQDEIVRMIYIKC